MFCLALCSHSGETKSFPLLPMTCGLYYMHSFSRNDDPRSLEFDPRKWQGNDETGGKHRISALLAQAGMGVNSREASGFSMSPPLGPTFGTAPTAPSSKVRKTEEPVLAGSTTGQMLSIPHLACLASEALSSSLYRWGSRSSQRLEDLPKTI